MLKYYFLCASLVSFGFLHAKKSNSNSCQQSESSIKQSISSLLKKHDFKPYPNTSSNMIEAEKSIGNGKEYISIHYKICADSDSNFVKITTSKKSEEKKQTTHESFYSKRKATSMVEESLPEGKERETIQKLVESVLI